MEGKMEFKKIIKHSFTIIGKEGSTKDGPDFVRKLWDEANAHFGEVAFLAKKDQSGVFQGFWGAMSDFSREFKPWEDFSQGLYLAGVEANDNAVPPQGWVKWVIPGFEYIVAKAEEVGFREALAYLSEHDLPLVGAVHEYYCPKENGQMYLFFPIRKL